MKPGGQPSLHPAHLYAALPFSGQSRGRKQHPRTLLWVSRTSQALALPTTGTGSGPQDGHTGGAACDRQLCGCQDPQAPPRLCLSHLQAMLVLPEQAGSKGTGHEDTASPTCLHPGDLLASEALGH